MRLQGENTPGVWFPCQWVLLIVLLQRLTQLLHIPGVSETTQHNWHFLVFPPPLEQSCNITLHGHNISHYTFSKLRFRTGTNYPHVTWQQCVPAFTVTVDCHVTGSDSCIHSAVCHMTGPQPVLHTVRSNAFSFNFQYPLLFLRKSSSSVRLLPRLPVTHILPSIFPLTTCCRRQFLRKMQPIHLAFLLFTVRRTFLSFITLCNTSSFLTRSVQLISIVLQHHISKRSGISDTIYEVSNFQHHTKLCFKFSTLLVSS